MTIAWPALLVTQIADAVAEHLSHGSCSCSQSPWLDVSGTATYLLSTPDAVRKAAQRGLLPGHQPYGPGSRWLFHRDELDAHIRSEGMPEYTPATN
jgi:hypothetical protein